MLLLPILYFEEKKDMPFRQVSKIRLSRRINAQTDYIKIYSAILPGMVIRKLAQTGDPVLKAKNMTVTSFKSLKVQQVVENLIDTMYAKDLIGIAAPQIGENYRIFVTHARNTKTRSLGKEDILRIYINPKISFQSAAKTTIYEGCGSVNEATIFGPVDRSKEITVVATDMKRRKFTLTCDGILARILLHEYDHLQGIEFTEKIVGKRKKILAEEYEHSIKNSEAQIAASLITKIEYTLK